MRCPTEKTWRQGRGPSDPRRGTIHQCVLESGHPGPCAMEPTRRISPGYVRIQAEADARADKALDAVLKPQTPEQIAAGDARYREHLRRKYAR